MPSKIYAKIIFVSLSHLQNCRYVVAVNIGIDLDTKITNNK